MIRVRTFLNVASGIRLLLAFVLGVLLGVLASRLGAGMQNVVPYLLFPLVVGVIGACTIGVQHPRPYLMASSTGLVAWIGIGASLLITSRQTASTPCTGTSCSADSNIMSALLIFYVFLGLILVLFSALITHLLVRHFRQAREQ